MGWTDRDDELTGLPGFRKEDPWQNTEVTVPSSNVKSRRNFWPAKRCMAWQNATRCRAPSESGFRSKSKAHSTTMRRPRSHPGIHGPDRRPRTAVWQPGSEKRTAAEKRNYIRHHRPRGISVAEGRKLTGIARSTYYDLREGPADNTAIVEAMSRSGTARGCRSGPCVVNTSNAPWLVGKSGERIGHSWSFSS